MFEGLFDETDSIVDNRGNATGKVFGPKGEAFEVPPAPRLPCGLAGINNQGATCYLNSLLQTLLYTPEFRDCLFQLDETELGVLEERGQPGRKVRVIPIQLQRLFARLLLSDQQSVSTTDLTESFGWNDNEALQQQDVQELNRILFSAIEDSLVGTSGQHFISNLYHGKVVNQIICQVCQRVSEREEDFLDLTLTVAGHGSVEEALSDMYCHTETMDGQNQYRCEQCHKLVDAKKGAQLRNLPRILTLSLLRFSFNFQTMERYKETGKISFPTILDMEPYLNQKSDEDNRYELFSVVIHRGGAYGGHYHAYIRDLQCHGNWTHPEKEEIRLPIDPSTGNVDYLEVDTPFDLILALVSRSGDKGLSLDKLCSEMTKQTGVSWNKRFKKQYGPINKFLKKYDDHFDFDDNSNWITLKQTDTRSHDNSSHDGSEKENGPLKSESKGANPIHENGTEHCDKSTDFKVPKRPPSPLPEPGYGWFNFDDSRVHPIREQEIEKQFSGKESAYMLFYRRISKDTSLEEKNIPEKLVSMVISENEELHQRRLQYESTLYSVSVKVHFGSRYDYERGALQPQDYCLYFREMTLDRRKTLFEFAQQILEKSGEIIPDDFTLHRLKNLPSGGHLYEEFPIVDTTKTLENCGICNGTEVFVWDGEQLHGELVPSGYDCEPICLTVIYQDEEGFPMEIIRGFPKNLTFVEFKVILGDIVNRPANDLDIHKLVTKDGQINVFEIKMEDLTTSLESLKLKDGDQLVICVRGSTGSEELLRSYCGNQNKIMFKVENRCVEVDKDCTWPILSVEVEKEVTVGELKLTALSKAGLDQVLEGGRLRLEHETLGLKPPLFEDLTLSAANLTSVTPLVLEPGPAPQNNQMTLTFSAEGFKGECPYLEVTLLKTTPVEVCLALMLDKAGLTGNEWHLRKTNWCGELADILDDMTITIEEAALHHGDHVILEAGKLPPKGYLRLSCSLYPTPGNLNGQGDNSGSMLNWISQGIAGMFSTASSESNSGNAVRPVFLGEVEISKEASLDDLKLQVMTLPQVTALPIPTPDFMRLRLVEQGRLSTVLKGSDFTLQRLKVKPSSCIGVQVLPNEEKLTQHDVILELQQRLCDSRSYGPAVEIVWNTNKSASATSLRQTVGDLFNIPLPRLMIAKHFSEKFEWKIIHDNKKTGSKKGKKKFLQPKSNVKNSPYFVQDGDRIGVKDLLSDGDEMYDFTTIEDDMGKENLKQIEEDKRKRREEQKLKNKQEVRHTPRRPEASLHIKVDKFT